MTEDVGGRDASEGRADPAAATGADSGSVEPVARIERVGHAFDGLEVLDDVSLDLRPGSAIALIGPNGAGKTTLLRIVAGLLRPDAGRVRVTDGRGSSDGGSGARGADHPDGGEAGAGDARSVGYLPQSPSFRPRFSVAETLEFYADLVPGPVDVDAALDQVGLAGVRGRRVAALSGGMLRLLGVAQAIVGDPPLVVLDEPTGDLDPAMTDHVFEAVESLATGGTAVLLATHDLTGAERADEVAFLDAGRLVFAGPPADFVSEPGAASLPDAFLRQVRGEDGVAPAVRRGVER